MIRTPSIIIFGFSLFCAATMTFAESVKLTNASGKEISADYEQGTNDAPPVLLLHGFLQTNKFSTISRLVSTLQDSGFTVLSPTLSMGINNRKQSLSCEAVHTHSLDSDADEIRQWVEWLHDKTNKPVTVIGHSAGGAVLLKYMENSNAKYIADAILISLSYFSSDSKTGKDNVHAAKALKSIDGGGNQLDDYALSYCKTYPAYARDFLSYHNWDKAKVVSVVGAFNDRVSIILGTEDKRLDSNWHLQLQKQNNHVIMIDGANHFFDQAHEFDLLDTLEQLLTEIQ